MIRLYFKIILFVLPVFIVWAFIPADERLRYQNLENECSNQGIWIHDRLYNNPAPIDIAFLGSSRTSNGINDELITSKLKSQIIANLGYCRLGTNIYIPLLKDLFATKKPHTVVIDVGEYESRFTHPVFPYLADEKDLLLAYPIYNPNIFSDAYIGFEYKLQLFQQKLFKNAKSSPISTKLFGHSASTDTASIDLLNNIRSQRENDRDTDSELLKKISLAFPRYYLNYIAELCSENKVQLIFLYIPAYGFNYSEPTEASTYKKHGRLIVPPKTIFSDPNNWHDENHLNETGAIKFSEWLSTELKANSK